MEKKKKILTAVASAVVLASTPFIFTACGGDDNTDDTDKTPGQTEQAPNYETEAQVKGYSVKMTVAEANAILTKVAEEEETTAELIADNAAKLSATQMGDIMGYLSDNMLGDDGVVVKNDSEEFVYSQKGMYSKAGNDEYFFKAPANDSDDACLYHVGKNAQGETIYEKQIFDEEQGFAGASGMINAVAPCKFMYVYTSFMLDYMEEMYKKMQDPNYEMTLSPEDLLKDSVIADGVVTINFDEEALQQYTAGLGVAGIQFNVENGQLKNEEMSIAFKISGSETTYYSKVTSTYHYDVATINSYDDKYTEPQGVNWTDLDAE